MNTDAAEKYNREEILGLIEEGFKKLGVEAGQPEIAPMALLRALEGEFGLDSDRIHRSFELDRALTACKAALDSHGIPVDYVPPRLLARQILIARVQHNLLVGRLATLLEHPMRPACYAFCVVGGSSRTWASQKRGDGGRLLMSVEEVLGLSDEELDEFIDSMGWRVLEE